MKILLIYPPMTIYGEDLSIPALVQPLGLAYVAGYIEPHVEEVRILDARAKSRDRVIDTGNARLYGLTDDEVREELESFKPDVVGISCMWTAYSSDPHRLAKVAKLWDPKVTVVFGGAHASQYYRMVLKDSNIDLIVLGEGEETFLELLKALENKTPANAVKGIAYREGEAIATSPARERIKDLDTVPLPARHLLDMDIYLEESRKGPFAMRRPSIPMITSRGCPQRCIYCTIHSVWGNNWVGRSPKNVVDEIEHLQKKYGVEEVYWMDDSAGANKQRLSAICDEIVRRKVDIKWTTPNGIAHWTLDEAVLDKMKKAGCYRITFGIESGNPRTRAFIGKTFDLGQASRMLRHANRIGMWTICTFIIGFPYETKEEIEDTIRYAISCDTDMAVFYLLCPHPTSRVYEVFRKEGLLNLDHILDPSAGARYEDFETLGKILGQKGLCTVNFSAQELEGFVNEAFSRFFKAQILKFLNPLRILRKARSWEEVRYLLRIASAMGKFALSAGKLHSQKLYNKKMK